MLVTLALAEARGLGASDAEAGVSVETGLSVTARLGEVETLEYQRDRGMGVTVYRGKRKGSASTGDSERERDPRHRREGLSASPGSPPRTSPPGCPSPTRSHASFPISICSIRGRSIRTRRAIWRSPARRRRSTPIQRIGNSEGATLSTHRGMRVFGNSLGFLGSTATTLHSLSCVVVARSRRRDAARLLVQHGSRLARPRRRREHRQAGCSARLAPTQRAQAVDGDGAGLVRARAGARPVRSFPRRHPRRQPISPRVVPARRSGRAGLSGMDADLRASAPAQGARQRAVRQRRRRDARSGNRRARRADRLRVEHVLGPQARAEDDGQRRRRAQPHRRRAARRTSRPAAPDGSRAGRDRADGAGRQRRDRRLLARRGRLLGRERRDRLPGARDHDRRQSAGHVPARSSPSAATSMRAAASAPARCCSSR